MKQSLGIGMILLGAIMFHIASHGDNPGSIQDVWKSILSTISNGSGSKAEGLAIGPIGGGSTAT